MKKIIITLIAVVMLSLASEAKASEGFFELRNQVGEAARCHVTSGIMENQQFNLLTLCRDILYPGGTEVFQYVAWANPTDGGSPIRLGTLDLGKQLFKAREPFNSIFVTKELDNNPRSPEGQVVMQGTLQAIPFLGSVQTSPQDFDSITTPSNELDSAATVTPSPTEQAQTNSRTNVVRNIALVILVIFTIILAVVAVIFVVSRR